MSEEQKPYVTVLNERENAAIRELLASAHPKLDADGKPVGMSLLINKGTPTIAIAWDAPTKEALLQFLNADERKHLADNNKI